MVSRTVEIGLRGRLGGRPPESGRVTWNLSAFRTLLHDDIYGIATSVSRGFFQNIGQTRRQGFEAGVNWRGERFSAYLNYSLVEATFRSSILVPSPSNPFQDSQGNIAVHPGDRLPGIPAHRVKLGADYQVVPAWTVGATANVVSSFHYFGDDANQLPPIPGYVIVNLHSTYRPAAQIELFVSINNLFDRKYATWGILSDPTGVGAPGIRADGVMNGPGVDSRFQSPAAPLQVFGGFRVSL